MRFFKSIGYAWKGVVSACRSEANVRIHVVSCLFVVAMGFCFRIEPWEWCALVLASVAVISMELINTSIEHLTDLVTRDEHPLAGQVKDVAAAAVLIAAVGAIVVGIIIFGKHILILLF